MSLITETGAIIAGAEAYNTVAEADAYFAARGNTDWAALTTAAKEEHLRIASQRLDNSYKWLGIYTNETTQAKEWPRWLPTDHRGRTYDSDEIPTRLKEAEMELANQNRAEALDVSETTRKPTLERLDTLEVEYAEFGTDQKVFPWIDALVAPLTTGGGGSTFIDG